MEPKQVEKRLLRDAKKGDGMAFDVYIYVSLVRSSLDSQQASATARAGYIALWVELGEHCCVQAGKGGAMPQKSRDAVSHDRRHLEKHSKRYMSDVEHVSDSTTRTLKGPTPKSSESMKRLVTKRSELKIDPTTDAMKKRDSESDGVQHPDFPPQPICTLPLACSS